MAKNAVSESIQCTIVSNFTMAPQLTVDQRWYIYQLAIKYSYRAAAKIFNLHNPDRPISYGTVCKNVHKLSETKSLHNRKYVRQRPVRDDENNIFEVVAHVVENPKIRSRTIAKNTGVSQQSVLKILHDEKFKAYKATKVHVLSPADFAPRLQFANQMLQLFDNNEISVEQILFTDESLFTLSDSFNTQTTR